MATATPLPINNAILINGVYELPSVVQQPVTPITNGIAVDLFETQFPLVKGVNQPPLCCFKLTPPPGSINCFVAAGTVPIANTPLTLLAAGSSSGGIVQTYPVRVPSFTVSNYVAPTGTPVTTPVTGSIQYGPLVQGLQFPNFIENNITIDATATVNTAVNVTIQGYDARGKALQETSTWPTGQDIFFSNLLYNTVISITFSAALNTGISIQVGNGDVFGLPYSLLNIGCYIQALWNGAAVPLNNIDPARPWRTQPWIPNPITTNPVVTNNYTQTTRGAITLGSAGDGIKQLWFTYYAYGADANLNTELVNNANSITYSAFNAAQPYAQGPYLSTSALTILGAYKTTANNPQLSINQNTYVVPYITPYDLTGVAFPADLPWIIEYSSLLK